MKWTLPHKPSDMTLEMWIALLSRSNSECEIRCASPCDSQLEVDHTHSRGIGGETSLSNTRLVCKRYNRERGMTHDPKWEEKGYFDGQFDLTRLRDTQHASGPGTIHAYGDLFVGDKRLKLLESVSLFALTCGAGKTLLMVSSLFAICREVSSRLKHAPRPMRVIWFVHERDLCRQLERELKTEITKYKLHDIEPQVQICDATGDLDRGPTYHAITISCPQALWGGKNEPKEGKPRSRIVVVEFPIYRAALDCRARGRHRSRPSAFQSLGAYTSVTAASGAGNGESRANSVASSTSRTASASGWASPSRTSRSAGSRPTQRT